MINIHKTLATVHMTVKQKLAYRSAVWFGIAATLVSILVYFYLWRAIFARQPGFRGYTFPMMVTYVVLSRVLAGQFSGGINGMLAQWVYDGSVAMELLRPISLMGSLFAQRLGEFIQFLLLKAVPVALATAIALGALPPASLSAALLFTASVLLSIGLLFFIEFIVGLCSFYTLNYYGVVFAKDALLTILSGGLVPLALFPDGVQRALSWLPFQYLVSTPVNAYLGILSAQEALTALGVEALWTIALGMLAMLFYRTAIKKVVVQGG